jgi:nucleoside-diphosphate-sugar epimerase
LKIVGDGRNLVDISYIDNVADAHILAAQNLATVGTAAGNAFFISQGEPVVLWDWINELFNRAAIPPVGKQVSFGAAYKAGMIMEWLYSLLRLQSEPQMTRFLAEQLAKSHWFSINKAKRIFSYSPKISTSVGMDRLIDWLRQQDNLK